MKPISHLLVNEMNELRCGIWIFNMLRSFFPNGMYYKPETYLTRNFRMQSTCYLIYNWHASRLFVYQLSILDQVLVEIRIVQTANYIILI